MGWLADFKRDRAGAGGGYGAKPSRVTYMAHGKGYVMIRHPGCIPFVVTEKEWLAFPLWKKPLITASPATCSAPDRPAR